MTAGHDSLQQEIASIIDFAVFLEAEDDRRSLALELAGLAQQYEHRLKPWSKAHILRNLRTVCRIIANQLESESGRVNRCLQWFNNDLISTLGTLRVNGEDRRVFENRRINPDRRGDSILVASIESASQDERRKLTDRRTESDRRSGEDRRHTEKVA